MLVASRVPPWPILISSSFSPSGAESVPTWTSPLISILPSTPNVLSTIKSVLAVKSPSTERPPLVWSLPSPERVRYPSTSISPPTVRVLSAGIVITVSFVKERSPTTVNSLVTSRLPTIARLPSASTGPLIVSLLPSPTSIV